MVCNHICLTSVVKQTYVNRHVKVVRLERVSHITKGAEGVVSGGLLKAKCHLWLTTLLM